MAASIGLPALVLLQVLLLLPRFDSAAAPACVAALGGLCASELFASERSCGVCAGRQQAALRRAGCANADIEGWCAAPALRVEAYDPSTGGFLRDFQSWSWGKVDVKAKRGRAFAIRVPCDPSATLQVHGPLVLALGDLHHLEITASGSGADVRVTLLDGLGAALGGQVSLRAAAAGFFGLTAAERAYQLPFSAFKADASARVHRFQVACEASGSAPGGELLYLSGVAYTGFPRRPTARPVAVTLSPLPKRRGETATIAREVYGVNLG
jgi:hypothetical protein